MDFVYVDVNEAACHYDGLTHGRADRLAADGGGHCATETAARLEHVHEGDGDRGASASRMTIAFRIDPVTQGPFRSSCGSVDGECMRLT